MAAYSGPPMLCNSLLNGGRENEKAPYKSLCKTLTSQEPFYNTASYLSRTSTSSAAMRYRSANCCRISLVGVAMKTPGLFTPRQQRVINALRLKPYMREEIDRIAGASNGPQVISELIRKGFVINCIRVKSIDRDGKSCRPGRYYLQSEPEHG